MLISNSDGSLGINGVDITSSKTELFSLDIKGGFGDFKDADTLAFDVRMTGRDLQLIGSLFELEWPPIGPVTLESHIKQKGESNTFDTTLTAGKTHLDMAITSTLHTSPPHISGKVTAQEFFIFDLLGKKEESSEEKPPKKDHVFSRTPMDWSWLKKNDLDFSITVESFDKERSRFESARFEINLKAGHLSVSPAELMYPKGKLDLDVKLDVQDQPQFSLKAFGEDLNPRAVLNMDKAKKNSEFDAELDIDMKLMSSGASAHELAANLEGDVYMLVKNGRIRNDLLKLIFVDVVGWTFNKTLGAKYAKIECGVADYTVKQGVIDTTALYLDTPSIAIAGEGTVDLGNETIDYTFIPKKKTKLVSQADPVKVGGTLSDPSVSVIPLKSAATKYGTLFFAPYLFVGIFAAELATDTLQVKTSKSPCMDYEKKHAQDQQMSREKPQPESPAPD
jgi:hypothetical protein